MRQRFRMAGMSCILALLVVACSSGAQTPTARPSSAATPAQQSATAPAVASAPQPPKTMTKVRLDVATKNMPYAHHLIADAKGYYAEEGIDIEFIELPGASAVAAMLAGETKFSTSASTMLSAILKGADMKIVLTNADRPVYELWSNRPEIKTLQDLQGKQVGINSRGDTMELAVRIVLAKAGVDPNSVIYTALQSSPNRFAAFQAGTIPVVVLGTADVERVKQANVKGAMLTDLSKDVRMLFNGIATSDKVLREEPDLVERFLRATIKGREYFKRYKDGTIEIVATYNKASRELNSADYDSFLASLTEDGTLPEDVQASDAKARGDIIGVDRIRPMSQIYDYSVTRKIYDELKRTGWQPKP